MKYTSSVMAACFFLSAGSLCAQDIEKEFEEFARQQQQEFETFKNKADAEFETFLRETWKKFEAAKPQPAPERPEPPKPVEFDKTKPEQPVVSIKPGSQKTPEAPVPEVVRPDLPPLENKPAPGVYVPGQPYTPVHIEMPEVKPALHVPRRAITFYGTDFEVATSVLNGLTLAGTNEANVADAWKELCGRDYEQLVKDCMTLKEEKNMSDWAYLLFTKELGMQLYGAGSKENVVFLQMFLLNKSGYKVKLAKIDDELKLMIATAGTIYGTPYLTIEGVKYYVFEPTPGSSMSIYTYRQDFANAKNLVCLNIEAVPALSMEEQSRVWTAQGSDIQVNTMVNKNLIDFYRDYPQCDVLIHYNTPMSEELRVALYPQLKAAIAGKSQKEAASWLLNFVQTAFDYKTDGEQFGYEKPFFPDETFFYPYCDCEDRAMLYATLVKDLLELDAVLLDYPNHIASAVRFTEEVTGDHVVLDSGKYIICDPTYIGAPVGACMDQYKGISPEIIR